MRTHFDRERRVVLEKLKSRKSLERFERIERRRQNGELDRPKQVVLEGEVAFEYGETKGVDPTGIFDRETFAAQLEADARGWIRSIVEDFGSSEARLFRTSFSMHNPAVTEALESQVNRLKGVETTTWEAIKRTLAAGEAAGESMNKLVARVEQVFDTASGARAEMIARTEVLTAANMGKLLAAQQSGVAESKTWIAVEDNRTCPECHGIDGETVLLDLPFSSGVQVPPCHPDCRCTVIFSATPPKSITPEAEQILERLVSRKDGWTGRLVPYVPPLLVPGRSDGVPADYDPKIQMPGFSEMRQESAAKSLVGEPKWRLGMETPNLEGGEAGNVQAVNGRASSQQRPSGVARTEEDEDGSSLRNSQGTPTAPTQDTGGVVPDDD